MTSRQSGTARRRPRAPKHAADDPAQYLPLLARTAADKVRVPKEPLTRSAALASAPWDESMPAAWEDEFRRAYADRLEELGVAAAAKRSGSRGPRGYETKLERRLLSQSAEEFAEQDERARAAGLSWSTWARRKLSQK